GGGLPVGCGVGLAVGDGVVSGLPGMSFPPPQPASASDSAASGTKRDEIRYLVKKSLPGLAVWRCQQDIGDPRDAANPRLSIGKTGGSKGLCGLPFPERCLHTR